MTDLFLTAFFLAVMVLGLRRPFIWVLAYLYVDIVAPQKVGTVILASMPISLIAFVAAFLGWAMLEEKRNSRFTWRQGLIAVLLVYCAITTQTADFPEAAAAKWDWVWKALVFAAFLPLTLHTRLRIEAAVLVMVLSLSTLVVSGAVKTVGGGGGYGTLRLLVNDNTGLSEGSTISTVAIAAIPLIVWLARFGTIMPKTRLVWVYAGALTLACLLIPIGSQTRTGLLCIGLLAVLALRNVKRRFVYLAAIAATVLIALPFLPASYTERMSTIETHQSDKSASTRVAVWKWTLDYVADHPFGGGFDAYRGNRLRIELREVTGGGNTVAVDEAFDKARAYHSSYFEMLGEQGWPGLVLWLWLQGLGLWHMEKIRRRWKGRTGPGESWQAPLANALQQAQLVYLAGSAFVGIAFQPFMFMVIGLQCGLWSYLRRLDSPARPPLPARPALNAGNAVAAGQGALRSGTD